MKRVIEPLVKKQETEAPKQHDQAQPKKHFRPTLLGGFGISLGGSSSSSNNNNSNSNSDSEGSNKKSQKALDKKQKELGKLEKIFSKGKKSKEDLIRKQELKEQVKRIYGNQLTQAAAAGDLPQVEELLQRDRGMVNATDESGQTALHVASQLGHLAVVRALLRCKADCYLQDGRGWTALHCAAFENREDVMAELCKQRHIDFGATNEDDNTPLHYFARTPYSKAKDAILKAFLAGGADINAKNAFQETPLHQAIWKQNTAMAVLFIENGANPRIPNSKGDTPYDWLYLLNNKSLTDRVEAAIKAREAPLFRLPTASAAASPSSSSSSSGPINCAASSSTSSMTSSAAVPVPLSSSSPSPTPNSLSASPIVLGCTGGSGCGGSSLAGAEGVCGSNGGESSSTSSSSSSSWSIGKFSRKFLNLSPSPSPSPGGNSGSISGVTNSSITSSGSGNINISGSYNTGSYKQQQSPLTQQLKSPQPPSFSSSSSSTSQSSIQMQGPLMMMAISPSRNSLGGPSEPHNNNGAAGSDAGERMKVEFFMDAVGNGRVEEVRALLKLDRRLADCVAGPSRNTPLHVAALLGNVAVVKLLLGAATKAARNAGGWTPLMAALWRGHEAAALAILMGPLCADVGARLRDGNTALHFAARNAGPLVEFVVNGLVERGAAVDGGNEEGDTALHWAVEGNQVDLVRMLVAKGANKGKANRKGETPLDVAVRNSFTQIIAILN